MVKTRLLFLLFLFTALMFALVLRVGWLQIAKGEWYKKEAFLYQTRGSTISPKRGSITDRNGKDLAVSISVDTVAVNPKDIEEFKEDTEEIAQKLSELLNLKSEDILKKLNKSSQYEIIMRKVDKDIGNKLRKWVSDKNMNGIYIDEDSKRVYPYKNRASHVIGFTNIDSDGIDGIEKMMNQYLKGTPGKILSEVDAGGLEVPFEEEKRIDTQDGSTVVLTIDDTIQNIAENALKQAIEENKVVNGGTAIVMDPRTGEILALASNPDFDLNNPYAAPSGVDAVSWKGTTEKEVEVLRQKVWRNKAVEDTYEPGSTFKAITSAMGLEEGVVNPDSPVNDFNVKVSGWTIKCYKENAHGNETFREGVYHSCNPVFVRLSQILGVDRFYKYVKAFGFYDKTGIELPGEAGSMIHAKPQEIDMAVGSFGQSFQIEPIQLIQAYGAIANGGKLVKAHVVKEIDDAEGNIIKRFEPEVFRNVISKQTSDTMKDILEGVVSNPGATGGNAYVRGYRVAGKTATSETLESRKKISDRYIASFSAFAPADNPVICVLVVLDFPTGKYHTGGYTAGPAVAKIIEDSLSYLGVERKYTEQDKKLLIQDVTVPDMKGMKLDEAINLLKERGLEYKREGSIGSKNVTVLTQNPKPGVSVQSKSVIILYTYKTDKEIMVKVPDLRDKTISEATKSLNNVGLNIRVSGMGMVAKQSIEPGKEVPKGLVVEVDFRTIDPESQ